MFRAHGFIRVVLGFRLQNTKCMTHVDLWKKLNHSNIVQLKEVFTTKAFGDNCKVTGGRVERKVKAFLLQRWCLCMTIIRVRRRC